MVQSFWQGEQNLNVQQQKLAQISIVNRRRIQMLLLVYLLIILVLVQSKQHSFLAKQVLEGVLPAAFKANESNIHTFTKAVASAIGHGMNSENIFIDKIDSYEDCTEISYHVAYSSEDLQFTEDDGSERVLADCLFTSVGNGGFNMYLSSLSFYSKGTNVSLFTAQSHYVTVEY